MIFLNYFSTKRYFFFFYLIFFYFFVYNSFHAITEEVCVSICFVVFSLFLLYFITGKGLISFQKSWYTRFLKAFDLVLLSLTALHKIFSNVFVGRTTDSLNFFDVYKFFFFIFKVRYTSFTMINLGVMLSCYHQVLVAANMEGLFTKFTKATDVVKLLA